MQKIAKTAILVRRMAGKEVTVAILLPIFGAGKHNGRAAGLHPLPGVFAMFSFSPSDAPLILLFYR